MSSAPSPYTTLSARVSCEREIKKSKFIAIASRISDDRSAQSFLSELGTGGLVRAYGGVASECLKCAATCLVKPKAQIGMEVPFELLGAVYHQLQHFQAEDIKQDYETGNYGTTMVTFKLEYGNVDALEDAINSTCSRKIHFYKQTLA